MKQNKNFILKSIEGHDYLCPYGQALANHRPGLMLNATGVWLWNLLEQEHTMEELLSQAAAHYEIEASCMNTFQKDITEFVYRLIAHNMLDDTTFRDSASGQDSMTISIGGLGIQILGYKEFFPPQLQAFSITDATTIHMHIALHAGTPFLHENGVVLIRNKEVVVMECENKYILVFPSYTQLEEVHLSKDGSEALCYCRTEQTDILQEELFFACRILFLYLAQKHNMVAIHSSSILYRNKLWLFAGASGTGKSTHTRLWQQIFDTPIINGDLNLITYDADGAVCHGIPWCGTSGISHTESYPIGGIVLLKQSSDDKIEQLPEAQKQLLINQRLISPAWTKELFQNNLNITAQISKQIMVCRLHCTRDKDAAIVMKQAIDQYLSQNERL